MGRLCGYNSGLLKYIPLLFRSPWAVRILFHLGDASNKKSSLQTQPSKNTGVAALTSSVVLKLVAYGP